MHTDPLINLQYKRYLVKRYYKFRPMYRLFNSVLTNISMPIITIENLGELKQFLIACKRIFQTQLE